jgi:hypothetical protein
VKNIAILILILVLLTCTKSEKQEMKSLEWSYVYFLASTYKKNTPETCIIYADAVTKYCGKYSLPVKYIARQIFAESRYDASCVSTVGARGACQLMRCHDQYMREAEKYNPDMDMQTQYHLIYPSVEVQCRLIKNYLTRFTSYETALICYWSGENSGIMSNHVQSNYDFKSTIYYKYIMQDEYLERYIIGRGL